jgi:hypothetical protein
MLARGVTAVRGLYLGGASRVLAVRLDDGASAPATRREVAHGRLPGIDARPRADGLAAFLERLGAGRPLALLVDGAASEPARWAATRRDAAVHAVPPGLAWSRLARTACLAAAGNARGAASVASLQAALEGHWSDGRRGDDPFVWTGAAEIPVAERA